MRERTRRPLFSPRYIRVSSFSAFLHVHGGSTVAFIEYDVSRREDMSVVPRRGKKNEGWFGGGGKKVGGTNDNRNGGGRKTGEKWKFRGARRRKNAARYWSIDTLLRRLRCLRESSRRKNKPANRSGRILLGAEETPRGTPHRRFSDLLSVASCDLRNFVGQVGFSKCDLNVIE